MFIENWVQFLSMIKYLWYTGSPRKEAQIGKPYTCTNLDYRVSQKNGSNAPTKYYCIRAFFLGHPVYQSHHIDIIEIGNDSQW